LIQGGKAVVVQVTVTCPAGAEVLEAFLYVTQDGNQSQFASFQPICDDTPHTFTVRAQAVGFRFQVGEAMDGQRLRAADQRGVNLTGPGRHAPSRSGVAARLAGAGQLHSLRMM
jgi:hypothetical protein